MHLCFQRFTNHSSGSAETLEEPLGFKWSVRLELDVVYVELFHPFPSKCEMLPFAKEVCFGEALTFSVEAQAEMKQNCQPI